MPHISKGGKFIYGWCKVKENGIIQLPKEAIQDYKLENKSKIILISGSKTSGGFSVTEKEMLQKSELNKILKEIPELIDCKEEIGKPIQNKGRIYCWTKLLKENSIKISKDAMNAFGINEGDNLLAIRSSNIAFVCIVKGPIIERAKKHPELNQY